YPFVSSPVALYSLSLHDALPIFNQGMGICDELDAALLHALHQDPARRFSSATEMREVLEAILNRGGSATLNVPTWSAPVVKESDLAPRSESTSELHQLHRLAATVERFWIRGVLGHDKRGVNFPQPPRTVEPEWVGPASVSPASLEPPPPVELSEEAAVLDVFDECAGRLAILGAPGTGKTLELLELANALLSRSYRDASYGVPVVLALGAWNARSRSLADWIVSELESKYATGRKWARRWLQEGQLVVLLDGLDEVPPSARQG